MSSPGRAPRPYHQIGHFAWILSAAAAVVGLVGIVRLERQFPAAGSSPALLVPFLLPVLALALEAGALIALSVAHLRALGSGTVVARARFRQALPLLGVFALSIGVAELIPRGTEHPGAFANRLLQTARASCGDSGEVPVPLLGLSVSCREPRRIHGPMPGMRSIQVAFGDLAFSDDLRRVDIGGLELTAARSLRVHLLAGRARIVGLAPWSRSPRLSPLGRCALLLALGTTLWLAALGIRPFGAAPSPALSGSAPLAHEGRLRRAWRRLLFNLLFAAPGVAVAVGFIGLDQEQASPLAYAGAALLGVVGLGSLRVLWGRLPRISSSFKGF